MTVNNTKTEKSVKLQPEGDKPDINNKVVGKTPLPKATDGKTTIKHIEIADGKTTHLKLKGLEAKDKPDSKIAPTADKIIKNAKK